MGWTDDMYGDDQYDDFDDEYNSSTFNEDSDVIEVFNEDNVIGFTARYGEGQNQVSIENSNYVMNEDGSFRDKTQMELIMRDYGLYIAIIGGFFALKVL